MVNALEIKRKAIELGADLVGIADLRSVDGLTTLPQELMDPCTHAVMIAVAISPDVFEHIKNEPTPLYLHHYQEANMPLVDIDQRL